MPKVHNHYDNLKVARDASPQDIRAAYRALTRQYHPDRNPGHADAQRVMSVINVAYEVLSDPAQRRDHDLWIRQAEAPSARPLRSKHTLHAPTAGSPESVRRTDAARRARPARPSRRWARAGAHLRQYRVRYALAATAALCLLIGTLRALLQPAIGPQLVATAQNASNYLRPASAPNGQDWPARSAYVAGYPQMNEGGRSEITVDNAHNDGDMFVKLFSLDGPTAVPVRSFFVAARGRFALGGLPTGTYDLRYRNLATGTLARSPALILEEVRGTEHSATTVKLYQAGDGKLQSYALGDADF